jgi:aspartyl-tRNA(Asn)/glutamyl-tRNA(Gln) amidotransferase subunit A
MKTIHEAADAIRERKVTPVELVQQCLANIDRWEERVRAWVFVDRAGALAEAKRLTQELERGQYRGPLHGIPIGVKDIFDVFDWPTAAGSKLWANSIARQDADVIRQLRQAGAIFLGKTVTTQYASFDPPITRNPWNLERTPGGSSSGSAAAVATGMCLGALGSQTGGSITRPASYCGVAGCKPAYGAVSLNGIVPLAPSMDHPGPIGNCVADLAILLQAMAATVGPGPNPDYLLECRKPGPPTLLRARGLFHEAAEPAVQAAMDEVSEALAGKGATIRDVSLPAAFSEVVRRHRVVMAVEAAQFHRERLTRHQEDYLPCIRALLEEGLACSAVEYADCKRHQKDLNEAMTLLAPRGILLTPATTSPAPNRATTGNPAFNSPWSYTGLATTSIPTGQFVAGLPLAIQLVCCDWRSYAIAILFQAGAWCEKALGVAPLTPPLTGN